MTPEEVRAELENLIKSLQTSEWNNDQKSVILQLVRTQIQTIKKVVELGGLGPADSSSSTPSNSTVKCPKCTHEFSVTVSP